MTETVARPQRNIVTEAVAYLVVIAVVEAITSGQWSS